MMSSTSTEIVNKILEYINKCSGQYYSDFYVGITNDIETRLFDQHNVPKENYCWIYLRAVDIDHARHAEKYLLDQGMSGGSGGGDDTSVYVYCYEISNDTIE